MTDALKLVWLGDDNPLPFVPYGGLWHYVTAEPDKPETMRWLDAHTRVSAGFLLGRPKALVPVIEVHFKQLIDFLCDPMPEGQQFRQWEANPLNEDHTLYVALRSSYVADPDLREDDADPRNRYLLVGVAQFPTILEGSFEFPWVLEPITPLVRILHTFARLHVMEAPPDYPQLVPMWEQMFHVSKDTSGVLLEPT